jgi:Cd2+/Zn2+-exporting ATPase
MVARDSIFMSIIILVSASPCALALATPVAVLVGISRAASEGVLIKGGAALENLGLVKMIAFDKTGTLTEGKPAVIDVVSFNGYSISDVMAFAYGLELGSVHPLALAVINYCTVNNIAPSEVLNIQSYLGRGIVGEYKSKNKSNSNDLNVANLKDELGSIRLGNPKMFADEIKVQLDGAIEKKLLELENRGLTTVLLMMDNKFIGIIAMADQLRSNVSGILQDLKQLGVLQNIMLTGDNEIVAKAIARDASVDKFYASLLPEDKLTKIKELTARYTYTAMVGDGVNDAPAMANATVGIAMGGSKMDVAIETSNIVLMNDKLDKLVLAMKISQKTRSIIKQNLFISLGVIGLLVSGGLLSITSIGFAVLIHEGSSLVVIFNALRIFKIKKN